MKWIPVSERKPPVGSNIMIWSPEGHAAEGEMNSAGEFIQYRWSTRVKATHWAEMDPGPGEQKTADQMFREMGYERIEEISTAETSPILEVEYYRKRDNCKIIVDRFQAMRTIKGRRVSMFYGELLACAQLLREMEQENG